MRGIICIAGTNAWHFLGCSFSQCPLSEPYHQPCSSELHGQHQVPGFGGGGRHRFQCRARRGFAGRRDSTRRICQISFQITHHCQGMKCNVILAFLNHYLYFFRYILCFSIMVESIFEPLMWRAFYPMLQSIQHQTSEVEV